MIALLAVGMIAAGATVGALIRQQVNKPAQSSIVEIQP
jgi:hypothetical protein